MPTEVPEDPIPDSTAGYSSDPPAVADAPETAEEPVDSMDSVDPPESVTDQPEEPAPKTKANMSRTKSKAES